MAEKTLHTPKEARLPVVDVGPRVTSRLPPGKLRIELLTDPWSVWCWGFEPIRRALELRHPTLEFRPLLGGMFPTMPRPEQAGFDVERFFSIVHRTTGMPIRYDGIRRDAPDSTYPACIHVHAVRLLAPERESEYLRALREAAYLDGLNISRLEVGAEVAQRVGLEGDAFLKMRRSKAAEESFLSQIESLHERNLHAYPTILFTVAGQTHVVEGFQSLPAVLGIAQSLTGRAFAPTPDPTLDLVVPPGERVATREVAEVLGMSLEAALDLCRAEEEKGRLVREEHPQGVVWSRKGKRPAATARQRRGVVITPDV